MPPPDRLHNTLGMWLLSHHLSALHSKIFILSTMSSLLIPLQPALTIPSWIHSSPIYPLICAPTHATPPAMLYNALCMCLLSHHLLMLHIQIILSTMSSSFNQRTKTPPPPLPPLSCYVGVCSLHILNNALHTSCLLMRDFMGNISLPMFLWLSCHSFYCDA